MKVLRFTSVLLAVIAMTACNSDIITDGMETENVKTMARRKVQSGGEPDGGGQSQNEKDTCKYVVWEPLDTIVVEHIGTFIDLEINVTCNGGFSSQLQPKATYNTIVYQPSDSSLLNNIPTIVPYKCEMGNNGRIFCYYYINGYIDYASAFLKQRIESVPKQE